MKHHRFVVHESTTYFEGDMGDLRRELAALLKGRKGTGNNPGAKKRIIKVASAEVEKPLPTAPRKRTKGKPFLVGDPNHNYREKK